MKPKIIKNEAEHATALARIEEIFVAQPGTPEGDELELLVHLVEAYEKIICPIDLPSPLAAIRFRMEQQNLKAKDLVPYIGSASKVSEVLSGRRPLSISMIRKLVTGLGIPAEVLLQEVGASLPSDDVMEQAKHFPVAQMIRRGWFPGFEGTVPEAKSQLEDLMRVFVGPLGLGSLNPSLNRQQVRDGAKQDGHALLAWRIRITHLATQEKLPPFRPGTVTPEFLRELARLSYLDAGPLLAKEFLNKNGIHLVCERHLSKTHLDGAATRLPSGAPVIGLTLRYDRLDNFWFTLFHELAHISLHLGDNKTDVFFDDLTAGSRASVEKEADELAGESLIPAAEWKAAKLTKQSPASSVVAFAERLRISPAIPAGRIRFESKDYTVLKHQVGAGRLRPLFGVEVN
jgi:HTH-type transcriptional regulator/antitoxin HigA